MFFGVSQERSYMVAHTHTIFWRITQFWWRTYFGYFRCFRLISYLNNDILEDDTQFYIFFRKAKQAPTCSNMFQPDELSTGRCRKVRALFLSVFVYR